MRHVGCTIRDASKLPFLYYFPFLTPWPGPPLSVAHAPASAPCQALVGRRNVLLADELIIFMSRVVKLASTRGICGT